MLFFKINSTIGLLFLTLCLVSCRDCSSSKVLTPIDKSTDVVVILVDLSTSLKESQVELISSQVVKIFGRHESKSHVFCHPIDQNTMLEPLGSFKGGKANTARSIHEEKLDKDFVAKQTSKRVLELFKSWSSETDLKYQRSCITSCLSIPVRVFQGYREKDSGTWNYYLYILSDMHESCPDGPFGALDLKSNYKGAISKVNSMSSPGDLSDVNIYPIVNQTASHTQLNSKAVSESKLNVFWSSVFNCFGKSDVLLRGGAEFFD